MSNNPWNVGYYQKYLKRNKCWKGSRNSLKLDKFIEKGRIFRNKLFSWKFAHFEKFLDLFKLSFNVKLFILWLIHFIERKKKRKKN